MFKHTKKTNTIDIKIHYPDGTNFDVTVNSDETVELIGNQIKERTKSTSMELDGPTDGIE